MRTLHERLVEQLVTVMTLSFLALAVAQGEPATMLLAGIVAVAFAALLVARYVSAVVHGRALTPGERAEQHRQALERMPAPRHPNTAGRPRTRAPSLTSAVA